MWLRKGVLILFMIVFIAFLYWFNEEGPMQANAKSNVSYEKAKVVEIMESNLADSDDVGYQVGKQMVKVKILSGKLSGKEYVASNYISYLGGVECKVNQTIIVNRSSSNALDVVNVYTAYRAPAIYGFVALFVIVIILIGGKQGLQSVLGLAFTFVCIIFLFIPMIYRGYSPFLSAVIIVILTTLVTMYLIAGASCKAVSAMLGTIIGVVISGIAAQLFGWIAGIDGFNISDAENLVVIAQHSGMQVGGILFAGILIASLGAVMDVAMSISSTLQEIYDKNQNLTSKELFKSGMTVGKDMMGTMSNTLILAFTGGSITSILFIYAYSTSMNQFMNTYSIGIEVMQGIAGSLGVILTVPIVSLIAATLIPKFSNQDKKGIASL